MSNELQQVIGNLATALGVAPEGLYETLIKAAYIASVQNVAFFIVITILVFVWVKAFKKFSSPKYKSDLTSAILFATSLPLMVAFIGSFVLLFVSIGWIIDPDSYLLVVLKDSGIIVTTV